MADNNKTVEQLQAELEETRRKNAELQKAMDQAATNGKVSPIIEGTFSVKTKDPKTGKDTSVKFKFKNGRTRTPLRSGQQVPSACLIKLANGTKHEDIDCDLPWFTELTQEDAQAELTRLAEINAATIEQA